MNKKIIVAALLALVIAGGVVAAAGQYKMSPGPAPNSGDGIPDGSGFTSFDGPGQGYGPGPAPNSHDGISDGPGW